MEQAKQMCFGAGDRELNLARVRAFDEGERGGWGVRQSKVEVWSLGNELKLKTPLNGMLEAKTATAWGPGG
jgi:hypothetical protein